jgi:hypothetical protein
MCEVKETQRHHVREVSIPIKELKEQWKVQEF